MGESTYRAGGVGEVNLQVAHGFDDGHDGLDGVAVDDRPVLPAFLLGVAVLMDDPGSQGAGLMATECRATWGLGLQGPTSERTELPPPPGA